MYLFFMRDLLMMSFKALKYFLFFENGAKVIN